MLTSEERALFVEIQDLLLDLFVQHDEASRAEDWSRVRALETEIDDAMVRRDEIRRLQSKG
jgi:hypothetical protein